LFIILNKRRGKSEREVWIKRQKVFQTLIIFKFQFQILYMADIWEHFKNLFQKSEQSSPSNPFIHELIERSSTELEDYDFWKNTLVCKQMQQWVFKQFDLFLALPQETEETIDFLNTVSSKGFVLHLHKTNYSKRDALHFFDFLKEKVKGLNYKSQISDRRVYNKPNWVEQAERHYLKPRPSFGETGKLNQAFGNITVELIFRNEKVYHLKFSATRYNDHLFEKGKEFQELMENLFLEENGKEK